MYCVHWSYNIINQNRSKNLGTQVRSTTTGVGWSVRSYYCHMDESIPTSQVMHNIYLTFSAPIHFAYSWQWNHSLSLNICIHFDLSAPIRPSNVVSRCSALCVRFMECQVFQFRHENSQCELILAYCFP